MGLKTDIASGALDPTLASSGVKLAGVGGVFSAIASGFAGINWVTVSGVLVAVGGFLVNAYFNRRSQKREDERAAAQERREQELHEAKLAAIRGRCDHVQ